MFRQDEPYGFSLSDASLSYEMFDYYHQSNTAPSSLTTAAAVAASSFSGELTPAAQPRKRRRRRMRSEKKIEDIEHQRMTHIAVERNRRKQMNHLLFILRSIMPPSYSQRGDQASIVGGAIKYIKELEQILQSLESQEAIKSKQSQSGSILSNLFILPQCSTSGGRSERRSRAAVADVEVTMVERHAMVKVLTKPQPRLLFNILTEFHSLGLTVLCLNLTTSQHSVLFTFSVKVEDAGQVTSVDDIASAVHEFLRRIQREN